MSVEVWEDLHFDFLGILDEDLGAVIGPADVGGELWFLGEGGSTSRMW